MKKSTVINSDISRVIAHLDIFREIGNIILKILIPRANLCRPLLQ